MVCFIKQNDLIQVEWMWADVLTIAPSVHLFETQKRYLSGKEAATPLPSGSGLCEVQTTYSCSPSPLSLHLYVHCSSITLKVKYSVDRCLHTML